MHMRKLLLLLVLILVTPSLFAQDDSWRDRGGRRYPDRCDNRRENTFELTPFVGYSWGGTLNKDTGLFNQNADLESSANYGINLGIPIGSNLKLALLVDRQSTSLTTSGGSIFGHNTRLGDIDVTYYQAGLEVPFAFGRGAIPYVVVTAGVANLDPKVPGASAANRFSTSAGLGVKVPINRNAGLRFEGRGLFTSTSNNNSCRNCNYGNYNRDLYQGQANLGIYFKF